MALDPISIGCGMVIGYFLCLASFGIAAVFVLLAHPLGEN